MIPQKLAAQEYLNLISALLNGQDVDTSAAEFDAKFLAEPGDRLDRPLFLILQDFWEDMDAYSPMWTPADESPSRITAPTLRQEAAKAAVELERYLAVGILSVGAVEAQYAPLGIQRGGQIYFTKQVLLDLLATASFNELCVLGMKGFQVTEEYTIPDIDLVADFAPRDANYSETWEQWCEKCQGAALYFLSTAPPKPNQMFCVYLWDRTEFETRRRAGSSQSS